MYVYMFAIFKGFELTAGSAVYTIPGAHPKRILHDMAHSQYLGTGKTLNGGALVVLCETGLWGNMQGPGNMMKNFKLPCKRRTLIFLHGRSKIKLLVPNLVSH